MWFKLIFPSGTVYITVDWELHDHKGSISCTRQSSSTIALHKLTKKLHNEYSKAAISENTTERQGPNGSEYSEQNDELANPFQSQLCSSFYKTGCEQAKQLKCLALDFVRKQLNCILPPGSFSPKEKCTSRLTENFAIITEAFRALGNLHPQSLYINGKLHLKTGKPHIRKTQHKDKPSTALNIPRKKTTSNKPKPNWFRSQLCTIHSLYRAGCEHAKRPQTKLRFPKMWSE